MSKLHKFSKIEVYWDEEDYQNKGWAWRADKGNDSQTSGDIDTEGPLSEAIEETCYFLGVDLTPGDFGCSKDDGGHAIWSRM